LNGKTPHPINKQKMQSYQPRKILRSSILITQIMCAKSFLHTVSMRLCQVELSSRSKTLSITTTRSGASLLLKPKADNLTVKVSKRSHSPRSKSSPKRTAKRSLAQTRKAISTEQNLRNPSLVLMKALQRAKKKLKSKIPIKWLIFCRV